ncbi:sodium-dependent multivitamin transporter [Trichonephila clavipes]|nr:sodium-dependent multivitamin transporter [Trichonephila clavipes]
MFPGLPGLFVAGVFSASLSSVSSAINSLTAVTVEDFLHPLYFHRLSEKWITIFTKITALSYGIICIFLTFIVDQGGGILTFVLMLFNVTGGPTLGLFCLGMLFRSTTSKRNLTPLRLPYTTPLDSDEDLVARISEAAERVREIPGIFERVR